MSELLNARGNCNAIHWQLLTTASVLALLPGMWAIDEARADDTDRPIIWIELGGQLERQTGQGDSYDPPFIANYASSDVYKPISPLQAEKPPIFSNGAEAKLSFQPEASDWVFSASVRYGRAQKGKAIHRKTAGGPVHYVFFGGYTSGGGFSYRSGTFVPGSVNYADTDVTHRDTHTIIDFQAGKDVGLGLFGRGSQTTVSVGVRFAQFTAKSSTVLHVRPDLAHYNGFGYYNVSGSPHHSGSNYPNFYFPATRFHVFGAASQSSRNFHGIGPSISWDSSAALLGNTQAGELAFDWGINAAVLFGRRIADGRHHESGHYHRPRFLPNNNFAYYSNTATINRQKSVTVPNVGGFAGVSFKFPNAKVSVGYRGDFFFGAMDTGWDKEKTKTVGFYGPFASVSFGIGG